MHCEKCGSADTEVVKCSKCGQKSRIKCSNCAFSNCTDKYCEVISIKKNIKILTYFAITLIVVMIFVLPVVITRILEDSDPLGGVVDPTTPPTPTQVASAPPTPSAPATPTAPPTPTQPITPVEAQPPTPSEPAAPDPAEVRKSVVASARELIDQKTPYKKGATDPSQGGIDFVPFVAWCFKQQGIDVPSSMKGLAGVSDRISDVSALEPGDVLFFSMKKNNRPNFVGVHLGGGKFACAYPKKKVLVTSVNTKFWKPRFVYGTRPVK